MSHWLQWCNNSVPKQHQQLELTCKYFISSNFLMIEKKTSIVLCILLANIGAVLQTIKYTEHCNIIVHSYTKSIEHRNSLYRISIPPKSNTRYFCIQYQRFHLLIPVDVTDGCEYVSTNTVTIRGYIICWKSTWNYNQFFQFHVLYIWEG